MATYLVPCRHCHMLISYPYYLYDTTCDHCNARLIERAEIQERLDRQRERRYTRG
jgi:hypothetical protein